MLRDSRRPVAFRSLEENFESVGRANRRSTCRSIGFVPCRWLALVSPSNSQQAAVMQHNTDKLRWGILGTAHIARKNWKAIRHTGNGTVVAVASRDLEKSRRFIDECQAEAPMDATPP